MEPDPNHSSPPYAIADTAFTPFDAVTWGWGDEYLARTLYGGIRRYLVDIDTATDVTVVDDWNESDSASDDSDENFAFVLAGDYERHSSFGGNDGSDHHY